MRVSHWRLRGPAADPIDTATGQEQPERKPRGQTIGYDAYNNVIVQFGGRGWDIQPDVSDIYLLRLGNGTPAYQPPPVPGNLRVQ